MRSVFHPNLKLIGLCLLLTIFLCACSKSLTIVNWATVPSAAKDLVKDMDEQVIRRFARYLPPEQRRGFHRSMVTIFGTTPVNLNTLNQSCALARQMTEEVSSRFMELGYSYQELRKGNMIRFDRRTGELLLTRNVGMLSQPYGKGQAVLAGTYVISDTHVRFSFSLIYTLSNEVLAKGSVSVPITPDVLPLLDETPLGGTSGRIIPSTNTKFR